MATLLANYARAYINYGRWVADCPANCGSAMCLKNSDTIFQCPECHMISKVEWPDNPDEIWDVLSERPAPRYRNWFPSHHELALRSGCPHGQTIAELRQETQDNLGGD